MPNELRFAVTLDDKGVITGFRKITGATKEMEQAVARTNVGAFAGAGRVMSAVEKGAVGFSGALGHAKMQVTGLMSSVGLLAGGAGLLGVAGAMSTAVNSARNFQSSMELLKTQAGATQEEVDSMSAAILDMARSVGTTPEQLATGLYHIESAGLRGAKALEILKTAAEGAKVGNADLESVTNALIAATNSGVKGVQDMSGAMGTLNAIVGSGNMRMEDLTAALGTGILSSAKVFGVSIQDAGAALAALTNQGIPAIDAANEIRSAMRLMAAPTSAAAKELKSIGLSSTALATDMRGSGGLLSAVRDLKTHMDKAGLSATEQAALLTKAFGGKQSQGILTLIGGIDKLAAAEKSVTAGAKGFSDAWAATQEDAQFKWDQFTTALSSTAIKIGTKILPDITDALGGIGEWIDAHGDDLANMFKGAVDTGLKFGKTAAGVVSGVIDAWNKIPGGLRDVLIQAFVANKVVKWTFGIDIAGSIGSVLLKGVGGLFKNAVSAEMNVEAGVVNVAGGAGTGGPGAAPGAGKGGKGGGGSETPGGGPITPIIGAGAYLDFAAMDKVIAEFDAKYGVNGTARGGRGQSSDTTAQAATQYTATGHSGGVSLATAFSNMGTNFAAAVKGAVKGVGPDVAKAIAKPLDALHLDFKQGMHDLTTATKAADIRKAADKIARDIEKGVGNVKTTTTAIDKLRAAQAAALKSGNTDLARALGADIRKVEAKLPNRRYVEGQLTAAERILASNRTQAQKLAALEHIQSDLKAHGDTHAAAKIQSLQNTLKAKKMAVDIHQAPINVAVQGGGSGGSGSWARVSGGGSTTTVRMAKHGGHLGPGQDLIVGEEAPEYLRWTPGGAEVTPLSRYGGPRPAGADAGVGGGNVHGDLTVRLVAEGPVLMTPGYLRQLSQMLGPGIIRWAQSNGLIARVGTAQSG